MTDLLWPKTGDAKRFEHLEVMSLPPEVMSLEGKIEKIERTSDTTGKITVVYYSEKQKQEVPGTGLVGPETKFMIDGVIATLAELREGERIRAEVRIEKSGGKRTQTFTKLHANRGR